MRVDIITIFPEYFGPFDVSLLGKARARGVVDVRVHDLRQWTTGPHRTVDDAPYGGGPGMVIRPEPWWGALTEITSAVRGSVGSPRAAAGVSPGAPALPGAAALPGTVSGGVQRPRVLVPTPSGRSFTQAMAGELAHEPWLVFCCGRYEGIDARVVEAWANDEVSIGDYVLAGGEVAALVMLEAVTRLLPGVVGNAESVSDDSFSTGLLEGPVYTRPPSWAGHDVPPVLLSGDHAAIARWRRDEALRRTARRRPELLHAVDLSERDRAVVAEALRGDADPGTLPAATPAVPTSGEDVAE